ncbi:MAG: PAS domain S-box protein [Candidatus Eisenbacteria bacterium]
MSRQGHPAGADTPSPPEHEKTSEHLEERGAAAAVEAAEKNYRTLFENQAAGLTHCQTVFDDHGKPIDYVILDVNAAYEKNVGIRREQIVGKRVTEAFPGVSQDLIDRHNLVAVTGQSAQWEELVPTLGTWFDVHVYCPARGYFIAISHDITERKRAEAEMRARERDLARSQAAAHLGSWRWDLRTDAVTWSDELFRIFGVDPAAFVPSNDAARAMIHPDDRDRHTRAVALALGGQTVGPFESRVIRPSGEERVVLASGFDVDSDETGTPVTLFGTIIDITERKRAEDELRASEERFRILSATAPIGVAVSCGGTFVYNNPAYEKILGCGPGELVGREASDFYFDRDDRSKWLRMLKETGAVENFEARWKKKDGTPVWVSINVSPILYGDKQGIISTAQDITDHKKAEEALRETRDHLQSLIGYANAPIIVWDPGFCITQFNRAFERLSGRRAEEVLGQTLDFLFPADRREESMAHIRRTTTGERWEVVEIPIQHTDGSVRTVLWNSATILSPDGKTAIATIAQGQDITERKRAEDERARLLSEVEVERDRISALVASVHDEVWFADTRRRFTLVNPAVMKEFALSRTDGGMDIEELAASLEVLRPDGTPRPVQESPALRALAGEVLTNVEEYIRTPSTGELRYRQASAAPVKDKAGRIIGSVTVTRDITDHKRAEEALRETRDYLQSLIGYANAPIIVWDPGFRITQFNRAFERLSGRKAEEVLGQTLDILFPADRREESMAHIRRTATGERWEVVEIPIQHTDGTVRTVLWNSATILSPDGKKATATIAQGQDITERKQAEEALRQSHERLKKVLEVETVGVMFWDLSTGRMTDANETFLKLSGYSRQEVEAGELTWQRLTPPEYVELSLEEIEKFKVSGRIGPYEKEYFHKDGARQWLVFAGSSLGGDACVEFCVDISDRKMAEDALREANLQLAEADRRKNEFLAVLSHELRNPLAPIANGLYILDRALAGGEEAKAAQKIIERQVRQLTRIVDDLLDITRIARGKIRLQRERLELNDLVGRTIEDHRAIFQRGDVKLEFEPAPSPVYVDGDWNRLGQSLGNLLQNAVKFTGRGGKVSAAVTVDPAARRAVVRVRDTGIGMTRETMSHLFEPFMQADMTLDRSRGGLGLGLALVKGIVELHGGEIAASSSGLGQGTEFIIRLPLDLTKAPSSQTAPESKTSVRRRVLIIEDIADAATSLRLLLELCGHVVEVASDGPGGVEKARGFRPEVLLCDIGLPGMDGYEVARAFRADEVLRDVFLVALSGYALPEDLQKAADAGFDHHMVKPPNLEQLQNLLSDPRRRPNGFA